MSFETPNKLPQFTDAMSVEEIMDQLKQLEPHYLYLASHAAFLPNLTPDLLYCVREEFDQDIQGKLINIPWITVADLLLSGLFTEPTVGREVYTMDREVEKILRKELQEDSRLGSPRIKKLYEFLLEYAQQKFVANNPYSQDLHEFQWWVALIHTQPDQAVARLQQSLWKAHELGDQYDLDKIIKFLDQMQTNIGELDDSLQQKLEPLFFCAKRMKNSTKEGLTDEDNLCSEVGVNYTRLRDYLRQGNWKDADQETNKLLLKVAENKATKWTSRSEEQSESEPKQKWLSYQDIHHFPLTDWNTIDKLWSKYSDGHFGFTVQKKIWQNLGASKETDYLLWQTFAQQVGWWVNRDWLLWDELSFTRSTVSPKGHLPALCWWSAIAGWDRWWVWGGRWKNISTFFNHI